MLVGEEYFKVIVLLLAEATDMDVWTNLHHNRMSHCVFRREGVSDKAGETVTLYVYNERRVKHDNSNTVLFDG